MKARNHKTLERAKYAFMLLQYLASGPHRGNQLAIAQTDIVSVVNRVLAVTTFKTKKGEHGDPGFRDAKHGKKKKKKKKKFEGGETKLAVWQQGRENIYHDLGERDIAASPAKYINESVTTFLLSLLEGQQKERVVTRLLTSLEWRHIESHLTALHIIMSMKDNRLMNLTKTALEVEIAATEKKLEEIGGCGGNERRLLSFLRCKLPYTSVFARIKTHKAGTRHLFCACAGFSDPWKPPTKKELHERHTHRLAEIMEVKNAFFAMWITFHIRNENDMPRQVRDRRKGKLNVRFHV